MAYSFFFFLEIASAAACILYATFPIMECLPSWLSSITCRAQGQRSALWLKYTSNQKAAVRGSPAEPDSLVPTTQIQMCETEMQIVEWVGR